MRVALVVGHSEKSPGATSQCGVSEFEYNNDLAHRIKARLLDDIENIIVYRKKYRDLPRHINQLKPDYVLCLHCNAFNTRASGTEVLYYHRSPRGEQIASCLQTRIVATLGLPDRGIKSRTVEDRGGFVLKYTKAPCVILEPFFIDNTFDFKIGTKSKDKLAKSIADCLINLRM